MILDGLARAVQPPGGEGGGRLAGHANDAAPRWRMERDPVTGQQFFKVPVPSEQALGRAAVLLQALAGAVGGGAK